MPVIESQIDKSIFKVNSFTARQNMPNYLDGNFWKQNKADSFKDFRRYIKLQKDFDKQVLENAEIFENEKNYFLAEKMKISLDALLNLMPDKISLEISYDGSVYYKMIMGEYQVFFEHFLIDDFDDADEAIFTIYKGDEKLFNYGGELLNSLSELNKVLINKSVIEIA